MRWNALKPGDVVLHDDSGQAWVCVKRDAGCSMMLNIVEGDLVRWDSSFHMKSLYYRVLKLKKARR